MGSSSSKWTTSDIPSQAGKIAIVTGANSGIGYYTALELASSGANVIIGCRSVERGEEAAEKLNAACAERLTEEKSKGEEKSSHAAAKPGKVEFLRLDLADLESVSEFAMNVAARTDKIHLLINNAGVMMIPFSKTKEGIEMQLGVNHVGHFKLTKLLFPLIVKGGESLGEDEYARIVTVSSIAGKKGPRFPFTSDYTTTKEAGKPKFGDGWGPYCNSKLANQLFHFRLTHLLAEKNIKKVKTTMAHPGWTNTNLQSGTWIQKYNFMGMDTPRGADPTLRAAVDPTANSGDYFGPNGLIEAWGHPVLVKPAENSQFVEDQEGLWKWTEEVIESPFEL